MPAKKADVSGLKASALRRYERVAAEAAREIERELRSAAPYATGELADSIEVTSRQSTKTRFTITMRAPVIQAATTNSGARPHVIRPRRAKVLSFHWPTAGGRVAFRSVNHPGNAPSHWWDRVRDRAPGIVAGVLRRF